MQPFSSAAGSDPEVTAGDGGDDVELVRIFEFRLFLLLQIANVLVVEIDVHESAQLAFVGEKMTAQIVKDGDKFLQGITDGATADLHHRLLIGILSKRGRNVYLHVLIE